MAFDFTNKVDPKASRAIYLQLLDMIQGQIQDKSLKPGDMLPSEKEFCQYYHISRTTVRLTFRELEQQGLIIRRRGLGTFISEPKVSRRLGSLYSFTEDMKKLGLTPSSQILSYRLISRECGSCALRKFQSERLIEVVRLRLANDALCSSKRLIFRWICALIYPGNAWKTTLCMLFLPSVTIFSHTAQWKPIKRLL